MEKPKNHKSHPGKNDIIIPTDASGPKQIHPLQPYLWKGILYFLIIAASIIFGIVIFRIDVVVEQGKKLFHVFEPFVYGGIFAYLLNPLMIKIELFLYRITKKKPGKNPKLDTAFRVISIFVSLIIAIVFIIFIIYLVLPEFVLGVRSMVNKFPERFHTFTVWVSNFSLNEETNLLIQEGLQSAEQFIENWMKTSLLEKIEVFLSTITVGLVGIMNVLYSFFIGIIVSVYILSSKERFIGLSKKFLYAIFKEKNANTILELTRDSHRIFYGFIIGKIVDSLIIGLICFAGTSLLRIPYALIVSVIVGVTNVIPFFGPYIGGIVGVCLILLTDFKAAIIFAVFVILLQQLDGNIIGPKILGETTGISSFGVIFSIIIGSGLFGFPGMLFGVPTYAVICHIAGKVINKRLKQKRLPTDLKTYRNLKYIKNATIINLSPEKEE